MLGQILYGKNSWTHLSLIGDETVINLQSTKVYVFSDSVLCLGKVLQYPESNEAWTKRVAGARAERSYRDYDATESRLNSSGTFSQDSQRCRSVDFFFYFHLHFTVLFFFLLPHCTLTRTSTSTTWTLWKITCAPPPRGATTPATSPSLSQVMSPTTRSPTSSWTPRVPSSTLLRHRTRTRMTLSSASYSLKYTENTPNTAVRKLCLSVRRQRLSRLKERRNPWKIGASISFVFVSETRTVLTVSCLQSPKLKEWSIERGNPWERAVPVHRLRPSLMIKDK